MTHKISLLVLLFLTLSMTMILECKGFLPSNVKVVAEPYQWDSDMKRLGLTTPERGLIFKITITNDETYLFQKDKLYINIKVESIGRLWSFYRQIEINYLQLPPKENYYHFVKIDFGGGNPIGSYSATLTHSDYIGENNPIEPYPFDFEIVSEEEFQRRVQQNPPPRWSLLTLIIENLHIEIIGIGSITILAIGGWVWHKKRQKKPSEKTSESGEVSFKSLPRKKRKKP